MDPKAPDEAAHSSWHNKTVVVVDDSKEVLQKLSSMYEGLGVKVVASFASALEFLKHYEELKPDFISLDIIMPEMNGVECFKKLKAMHPDLACVFVSWLAAQPTLIDGLKDFIAPARFVPKPFSEETLGRALADIFTR